MSECCAHDHDHRRHRHEDHGDEAGATPARSEPVRLAFTVKGLDCEEEVSILRRAVGPLVGGEDNLAFDVLNGRMMVLQSARAVGADGIREAVAGTGMSAEEWRRGQEDPGATERRRPLQAWFTAASGAFVLAGPWRATLSQDGVEALVAGQLTHRH